MKTPIRYPVAKPSIGKAEKEYIEDVMKSGWISSSGGYIEKFEQAFANRMGSKYAVAVSSGTNALMLALRAAGIGEGDEVIVPEFTMVASAWAVSYLGAKPVFVDCKEDLNIDVDLIEAKITPKTKAIMPVHIYGRPCQMDRIMEIAKEHNLDVIEDACEAHGADFNGQIVGTFGKMGCFSLYGNKIITSGEGGIIITDDEKLRDELVKLRGMYFEPNHTFLHQKMGYNCRMTNMQAAIALAQIESLDVFLDKRDQIQAMYDEHLAEYTIPRPEGSVLWMYDVIVDEDNREKIREYLADRGIETRLFFKPMSMQPMYLDNYGQTNAYLYSKCGFYLPAYFDLTHFDIEYICQAFKDAISSLDSEK